MKPFRFLRKPFTLLALTLLVATTLIVSSTNTALAKGLTTASPTNTSLSANIADLNIDSSGTSVVPNLVRHCGNVTCSLYFSRKQTREIAEWGPIGAEILGYIPGWVGVIINWAATAVQATAALAAAGHACLRVRYGLFWGLYIDNSGYCHNT
jgi:hypothetical protein